ncbi:hypothetical protein ACKKBF_B00945 [Auxenochlorella protothecoides x Auxenochlorella symbiontica]
MPAAASRAAAPCGPGSVVGAGPRAPGHAGPPVRPRGACAAAAGPHAGPELQVGACGRRAVLIGAALAAGSAALVPPRAWAAPEPRSRAIRPELTPDPSSYPPSARQGLQEATNMVQKGLNAPTLEQEIAAWSEVVDRYSLSNEPWAAEVAGRALGNRGNARARQGDMEGALADLDAAADKCPWAVDPVLNRGVVLEALGRWDDAIADFTEVLAVAPRDPAAWNNMGNAHAGAGRYAEALAYYDGAVQLAPAFSFAAANKALALYQLEQDELSLHEMRSLLRRYPSFVDVRAALTAALWRAGQEAEAEDQWLRVDDPRYRERDWLVTKRRWPPRLVGDLLAFLSLQSTVVPAA